MEDEALYSPLEGKR